MSKEKRTRRVVKDSFRRIERLWAEGGIVKVQDKNGTIVNMDIREAAVKAHQLNKMDVPADLKRGIEDLVERIITVCREAMSQRTDHSPDKKTKMINDVFKGMTSTPSSSVADLPVYKGESEDEKFARYRHMYKHINADEVMAVIRDTSLLDMQKMALLKQMNGLRANR
jgi:hypothetical protein